MKGMVSEVIAQDMKRLDAAKERMRLLLSTDDSALAKPYPTVGLLELAAAEIEALRERLEVAQSALTRSRSAHADEVARLNSFVTQLAGNKKHTINLRGAPFGKVVAAWVDANDMTGAQGVGTVKSWLLKKGPHPEEQT